MSADNNFWMPFFIGDYIADTLHLTTEQHGAYCLLIMAYWRNKGPLSENSERLASTCKLSGETWEKTMPVIKEFFDTTTCPGKWAHKRIDFELAAAVKRREVARAKGKKGSDARYGKSGDDKDF